MSAVIDYQTELLIRHTVILDAILADIMVVPPRVPCPYVYKLLWQGQFLDSYMRVLIVAVIPNQLISFCSDGNSDAVIANCVEIINPYSPEEFPAAVEELKARAQACRISLAEAIRTEIEKLGMSVSH